MFGTHSTIGSDNIWVPQHLFKSVYDPSMNRLWAHWLDNSDDAKVCKPISYAELIRHTRIQFLPDL
jgi:endonuclease G